MKANHSRVLFSDTENDILVIKYCNTMYYDVKTTSVV